jgi:hypothetical protein
VRYLGDTNLRAVLIVLIARAGGRIDATNAEIYDAMLAGDRSAGGFEVEETSTGLRLSTRPADGRG